jgi:hypothetical protein
MWGSSHQFESPQQRLSTPASRFSPGGGNHRRVFEQCPDLGRFTRFGRPRGDLNPETREISPVWGNFHGLSITADARRRHEFRVRPASLDRAAGDVRDGPLRGCLDAADGHTLCGPRSAWDAKYPPIGAPSVAMRQEFMLYVSG